VPVSIARGPGPTAADRLCAMEAAQAFEAAREWATNGPPRSPPSTSPTAREASCAHAVETATLQTAKLIPERVAAAPLVDFAGHVYSGRNEFAALEAAVHGAGQ
jgi:hypothetical protein